METVSITGLPLFVTSEDNVTYRLEPFQATPTELYELWEDIGKHGFMFSDFSRDDYAFFVEYVLSPGVIMLSVVDDSDDEPVGIVYADKIHPGSHARGHFFFWDFKTAGRQRVLFTALRWVMELLHLERVDMEVSSEAYAALRRLYKMGVMIEGRKRCAVLSRGRWIDQYLFGVLRREVTDDNIQRTSIPRNTHYEKWYGLLKDGNALTRAILKPE